MFHPGGGALPPPSKTKNKMTSKIEVRVFAVEQAVKIMGVGTPQKDVVAKAQEIEKYIIGAAELPEVADEASPMDLINGIAAAVNANAAPPVVEVKSEK